MKNSGIKWIGEIPDEWEVGSVKNYYKLQTGFTPDTKNESYYSDYEVDWLTISDLNGDYFIPSETKSHISQKYINEFKPEIVPKGSLLYSFKLSVGQTAFTNRDIYTNEAIAAFLQTPSCDLRFLYYSSFLIIENSNENIYGAKLLNQKLINNAKIVFPPKSIQQIIASYLDKKCSKIEETIQNQQQVIEKLKAYKQSLITEAVTGKIKIQNILPSFQYCNLGFIAEFKNGLNYNASDFGKEVKFLGVGDFQNYLVLNDESMFSNIITDTEIEDDYYLKNGDIIFVRSNGSKELVGRAIMVDNIDFKVTYSGFCIRLRNKEPQKINSKFLLYFFRSDYFRSELQRLSQGSNISNINQDLLSHIKIPLVDMRFQESVIDFLNKKCNAIDKAIEQKQKLIEKLTEYKKSLIYECVTGKKEI